MKHEHLEPEPVCAECRGTGVAEMIGGYERPCDACLGSGEQRVTPTQADRDLFDALGGNHVLYDAQLHDIASRRIAHEAPLLARIAELQVALAELVGEASWMVAAISSNPDNLRSIRATIEAARTALAPTKDTPDHDA